MDKVSPMMKHYLQTKAENPDCILFYRLGDFYEMFFDDALTVSREMELTLTGKACGMDKRAPMCGVPFHAADSYLNRLVKKGYKVAICEQVEDPKTAKGIVKRDIIRIVTPGTNIDQGSLEESRNNYIMSLVYFDNRTGIAISDVSTGDFYLTEVDRLKSVMDEISKYSPTEIICNDAFMVSGINIEDLRGRLGICLNTLDAHYFDEELAGRTIMDQFKVGSLTGLGISDFPTGIIAAGALLRYLEDMARSDLSNIGHITPYLAYKYMLLDSSTRRNLELTETMRDKSKRGSLLWVLDRTKTAMGARMLRRFIEQPLIDIDEMKARQSAIEALMNNAICRDEIREYLAPVYDLERIMSRISYKTANPRDLLSFRNSISMLPAIKIALEDTKGCAELERLSGEIDVLNDICDLIGSAIVDEPPLAIKDGGIIRDGYNNDIDSYRQAAVNGKEWLARLEEETRQSTGIKNLRIKYSNVFGYAFEVTNSNKDLVPDHFVRKQTLTNCERYTTQELKELEDTILGAKEKLNGLEYELFCDVRDRVEAEMSRIQKTAKAIALLDVYASLSYVAEKEHYVKPLLSENGIINIKEGRHPVIERMMDRTDLFISNDTYLDDNKHMISIITGPNMAGKSTYMRQTALIVLMAQIGSFVPASSAEIGIVDRIFTRVGASDDLGSGQSTFMVEMNEVANILRNASSKSLLILDEIGRGTSTYDGLSIAWAVIEHIANKKLLGAKTLFATHYHELTELEGKIDSVSNYCIAVKEKGDDIVFLRKIIKGGADKSYGIQVAKLAGIPAMVTDRARQICDELAKSDITLKVKEISAQDGPKGRKPKPKHYDAVDLGQMSLFESTTDEDVIEELKSIDISNLTPLDALNTLYKLQNDLKNRWKA
ncbi:DNA mismatch repair protein MutS [Butyrivibrio sp. MC2013]|uniref:DNA mismatch repair protein MutS n=1 Tax=Butyrivibrio sp. MC2013 TaxID=1280686 RepID=UPI00047C0531|nr:DNA mismatch repair protein MutS [Butyrivibrio sp. MC2013]